MVKTEDESWEDLIIYNRDQVVAEMDLSKASTALMTKPDCEDLQDKVLRLQDKVSRLKALRNQESQTVSYYYEKKHGPLPTIDGNRNPNPPFNNTSNDTQHPGSCKKHMLNCLGSAGVHSNTDLSETCFFFDVRSGCAISRLYRSIASHFS